MRVFLDVTEENIETGTRRQTDTCAVAQALTQRGFTNVSVCQSQVVVTKGTTRYTADPSPALRTFIDIFDGKTRTLPNGVKASRKTLQPATFRLDFTANY